MAGPARHQTSARRTVFRLVIMTIMAVCVIAAFYLGLVLTGYFDHQPGFKFEFEADALAPGVELYPPDPRYVLDPVVGHRPRRNCTTYFDMLAIDGSTPHHCRRRTNELGLVRSTDLPSKLTAPRLLLVGDSHLEGVVSPPFHAATLLESKLRTVYPGALVLNAASAYYSLYQYVLRIRTLIEQLRPDVIVVVVFAGNDFLELEDVSRPHLDDRGEAAAAIADPPAETTSSRRDWLGLVDAAYFWQGLNQATHFLQRPARRLVCRLRMRRCLTLLKRQAATYGAHLELVLLPPYDLVFPDAVKQLGDHAREVVESGVQAAMYSEFRQLVASAGISAIDLLPVFVADGRQLLYANDLHVYLAGHTILAEQMFEKLNRILWRRKRQKNR